METTFLRVRVEKVKVRSSDIFGLFQLNHAGTTLQHSFFILLSFHHLNNVTNAILPCNHFISIPWSNARTQDVEEMTP